MKKTLKRNIMLTIICSILLTSTAAAQILQASTDRYSLFAPWTNKASAASLSSDFKAYALLLDDNGKPLSGVNITFEIRSPAGLKATKYNNTQQNGLTSVSYDTINDFTTSADTDYGIWTVKAFRTGTPAVTDSTNVRMEAGGNAISGCSKGGNCHSTGIKDGAKPLSPYTDSYGLTNTREVAAHKKSSHNKGCFYCHTGYAVTKTGNGLLGDVHNGKACEFCHGNFTEFTNGIPKMPSCTQCHPVYNSNVKNVNTLATLAAGSGISVYSYNYDTKSPLVAHNSSSGVNYSLAKSVPCIVCHGPAHNNSKPSMSAGNSNTENEQCWSCHTNRAITHRSNTNCVGCHSQNAHAITSAGGGDKDCISCHDIGKSASAKVDVSKINNTNSIHVDLNSNGNTGGLRADNRICWGCHTNNTVSADNVVNAAELPSGDHPNGYNTPKNCSNCHIQSKFGALPVDVHYSGSSIIKTKSYSNVNDSCVNCHNKTEMVLANNDPGGPKSVYARVSHYGDNKTGDAPYNVGVSSNCTYCHNRTVGNVFTTEMIDPTWNSSIKNHSAKATNPSCTNCHNTGRIHASTLTKPTVNSTMCSNCHTGKNKHNGTQECNKCHLSSNRNIHPVQYLLGTGTWSQTKTGAVNCTDCHQGSGMSGFVAPIIPEDLKHSSNLSNGTIWGNYWTTELGACIYCHSNTNHNSTGLGKVSTLLSNPSNTKNGLLTNTNWCADCHRNIGNTYYKGNQWSPAPPTLQQTTYHDGMTVYKDENCRLCHTINGTYSATPKNYTHSLNPGSVTGGGDDCIGCHTIATGTGGKYPGVNMTVFTKHKNVNTTDGVNTLTNSDCKTCHYDTTVMSNVLTKTCNDCHTGSSGPKIENHRPVGGVAVNITTGTCSTCHNNSIAKYSYSANASTSHYATNTSLVSTKNCLYCHKNPVNGNYWGGATDPWNSPTFPHSLTTTTKEECYSCHGDISVGTMNFHNKTLKNPPLSSVSCLDCHKLGINMSKTKIDSSVSSAAVHKNKNCPDCHTGATTGNMKTYSVVANPPVVCTTCHTSMEHQPSAPDVQTTISCKDCHNNNGMYTVNSGTNGTEDAVVHYLNDVTDTSTTPYGHTGIDTSNCMDCHGPSGTYTGDINWGSPVDISTSLKRVHTETTITECNSCHKDGTVGSLADVDFHNSALTGGAGQGPNCLGCHAGVE